MNDNVQYIAYERRVFMTIRHLKIFITVAECGSMNTAAKELFLSQPTISQAIRELEEPMTRVFLTVCPDGFISPLPDRNF